ncbi:MAG TPA: aspartyl protease family protein [Planctomycetota bacterium]|nr:aspartyl protease family protein [Planctomycetota bacterium]
MRVLRLGDDTIYPCVAGSVGDHEVLFLVDTGCPDIGVSKRLAGVLPTADSREVDITVQTGDVKTVEFPLPDVTVGNIVLHGKNGTVIELLDRFSRETGTHVDGVLGAPLFHAGVVTLDYVAGTLTFEQAAEEEGEPGTEYLPIVLLEGQPLIEANVCHVGADIFILDTGMGWPLCVGPWSRLKGRITNRQDLPRLAVGKDTARVGSARLVETGRIRWENVRLEVIEQATQLENRVGSGFFADCRLTIDYAHQRIGVRRVRPETRSGWGLDVLCREGGLTVQRVLPSSPAERAGIRAQDRVEGIGGAAAAGSVTAFFECLAPHETVTLDLARGSERLKCAMTRAAYLPQIDVRPPGK